MTLDGIAKSLNNKIMVVYHGTIRRFIVSILQLGLLPSFCGSGCTSGSVREPRVIFVSKSEDVAGRHAYYLSERLGDAPVVLELRMTPDYFATHFKPDLGQRASRCEELDQKLRHHDEASRAKCSVGS